MSLPFPPRASLKSAVEAEVLKLGDHDLLRCRRGSPAAAAGGAELGALQFNPAFIALDLHLAPEILVEHIRLLKDTHVDRHRAALLVGGECFKLAIQSVCTTAISNVHMRLPNLCGSLSMKRDGVHQRSVCNGHEWVPAGAIGSTSPRLLPNSRHPLRKSSFGTKRRGKLLIAYAWSTSSALRFRSNVKLPRPL